MVWETTDAERAAVLAHFLFRIDGEHGLAGQALGELAEGRLATVALELLWEELIFAARFSGRPDVRTLLELRLIELAANAEDVR